ncbi:hypothetical protein JCM19037_3248 [Geomicrobium sp. JCM 19037]|nr:hypothetical protein JCM19037_3248 [Geomicrobium sp. JCM 19037]
MRIFLLQQLFLWVCMVVVVVLIAFLPRDLVFVSEEYETYGIATMNMQLYGERLSEYVAMIGSGSLGENRYGTNVLVDLQLYASRSLQLIGIASIIAIFIGTAKAYFDTRYKGIFARSSRKIGQGMQHCLISSSLLSCKWSSYGYFDKGSRNFHCMEMRICLRSCLLRFCCHYFLLCILRTLSLQHLKAKKVPSI